MGFFWLWVTIAIGSVVLEIATATALVSIWFALGAIVTMIISIFNVQFWVQVTVFLVVSLALAFTVRPLAVSMTRGNVIATNADRLIGMRTNLLEDTENDKYGTVKLSGLVWNVVSVDGKRIEKNTEIEVIAIEGSKLIVKCV